MSSDRMMATTYRFEINKGGKTNSRQMRQLAQIQLQEEEHQEIMRKNKRILEGFKTDWNNAFDQQNKIYMMRNNEKNNSDELKIIRRANLIARRDALRQLLLDETRIYEANLNSIGLTFHKERL